MYTLSDALRGVTIQPRYRREGRVIMLNLGSTIYYTKARCVS